MGLLPFGRYSRFEMYYRPRGIEGDELVVAFDAKIVISCPWVVIEFMAVGSDLIRVEE